jgi:hypothetical protein
MDKPINVTFNNIGIVNGLQTVEVIDLDTNEIIGFNQTAVEEVPDSQFAGEAYQHELNRIISVEEIPDEEQP